MKTAKVNLLKNIQLPESHIYKTHILDETGSIATTIVFSRGTTANANASSPSQSPSPSPSQTQTIVSEQQIHLDDSIRTIKQKILSEINRQKTQFTKHAYEEIYLFWKSANTGEIMRIGARIPSAANKYRAPEQDDDAEQNTDAATRENAVAQEPRNATSEHVVVRVFAGEDVSS